MPTSMVLRFRDLACANTILEHSKLIGKYGYVWWGWWHKPPEKIPRHTFAQFSEVIERRGALEIYLVDSGKELLYKATLKEIAIPSTEQRKKCPEPDKTPSYYSTQEYKAWFCLTSIEQVSSERIIDWSYDELIEFLDDPWSTRFQNKRIFSIQEMLRRHRTVYFIQPYVKTQHQDYLMELVPSIGPTIRIDLQKNKSVEVVPPNEFKDFVTTPLFRDSTYILHLSDLHFSAIHHGFTLKPDRAHRPFVDFLDEDLKKIDSNKPPAAVIISGDFTWQGRQEEFNLARDFINNLQSRTGLEPEHFVIVPGNHDIQWSEQNESDYDRGKKVTNPPEGAERNYRDFIEKSFGFPPNEFLSMGRRYILGNYIALDIIGLNSCRLEQKPFAGYGYCGLQQVNKAAACMNWQPEGHRVKYRLLVLHHHVIPVTAEEKISTYDRNYSLTLDASQLTYKALELGVDLIAHGHMHQPFASSVSRAARGSRFSYSRSLAVHGTGSASAEREHLGAIGKNSYSVYNFDEEGVTVTIRSWSENFEGFEEDWHCRLCRNLNGGLKLEGEVSE